jgi:hypothetical protein
MSYHETLTKFGSSYAELLIVSYFWYRTVDRSVDHFKVLYNFYEAIHSSVTVQIVPHILYETRYNFIKKYRTITSVTSLYKFCLEKMWLILYGVCSLCKDFRYLNFCWLKTVKIFSPKNTKILSA